MNKKTIIILSSFAIIVVISMIAVHYFTPIPIVKHIDQTELLSIRFNPESDHETAWYKYMSEDNYNQVGITKITYIDEKAEKEILNYLFNCMERRTFNKASSYQLEDVEIEIMLRTSKGLKQILLGNINDSNEGYGTLNHNILNAKEVQLTLKEIVSCK